VHLTIVLVDPGIVIVNVDIILKKLVVNPVMPSKVVVRLKNTILVDVLT
jgi:hypothetical protein